MALQNSLDEQLGRPEGLFGHQDMPPAEASNGKYEWCLQELFWVMLSQAVLPSQFKCTNGHCVALSYVCDHNENCGDLTDELSCSKSTNITKYDL